MPDDVTSNPMDGQQAAGVLGQDADGTVDLSTLPKQVQDYIRSLRDEAAANRVAAKEAKKLAQAAEQARLASMSEAERLKVYEQQVAGLTPYKDRVDTLEQMIRAQNDARIAAVPEGMRGLIPTDYPPERLAVWLAENQSKLTRPLPEPLDGGAGLPVRMSAKDELPADLLRAAAALGVKPDSLRKVIDKQKE